MKRLIVLTALLLFYRFSPAQSSDGEWGIYLIHDYSFDNAEETDSIFQSVRGYDGISFLRCDFNAPVHFDMLSGLKEITFDTCLFHSGRFTFSMDTGGALTFRRCKSDSGTIEIISADDVFFDSCHIAMVQAMGQTISSFGTKKSQIINLELRGSTITQNLIIYQSRIKMLDLQECKINYVALLDSVDIDSINMEDFRITPSENNLAVNFSNFKVFLINLPPPAWLRALGYDTIPDWSRFLGYDKTGLKPININLKGASLEKMNLDYQNFKLSFNANIKTEQKNSVYELLLEKLQQSGLQSSHKVLLFEQKRFLAKAKGGFWGPINMVFVKFSEKWWAHGLEKINAVVYTFEILLVFAVITFIYYSRLNNVYNIISHDKSSPFFSKPFTPVKVVAHRLTYLAILFFGIKLDIDKFKLVKRWDTFFAFLVLLIYAIGLFCLFFITSYILK